MCDCDIYKLVKKGGGDSCRQGSHPPQACRGRSRHLVLIGLGPNLLHTILGTVGPIRWYAQACSGLLKLRIVSLLKNKTHQKQSSRVVMEVESRGLQTGYCWSGGSGREATLSWGNTSVAEDRAGETSENTGFLLNPGPDLSPWSVRGWKMARVLGEVA